jgi:Rrf2 family iron-sulfur cluster assembly transcriptional regulator
MVDLKRAGLVTSVRGPSGGYLLTRDAADISARQIIEALEGPIEVVLKHKGHRQGTAAAVHETWHNCLTTLVNSLEDTSLETLAKMSVANSSIIKSQTTDSKVPEGYAFNI